MDTYNDYTLDELIATCISRQIVNGEVVVQGIATPLVTAGYFLAKCTHAPDLIFASAIGQGVCCSWTPLSLTRVEEMWLDKSLINFGFVRIATEILPRFKPKEFFRPAQMDQAGNFNNISMGRNYRHPRMRLPGSGGIPDVTTFSQDVFLYVPRHSRATFVAKLDFRSGLGHALERTRGNGPRYLISDLGQFDFFAGHFRLITLHPGVALEQVQKRTGFKVRVASDLHETPAPTDDEVHLLRTKIDPLGVRRIELLRARARKELLFEILAREKEL